MSTTVQFTHQDHLDQHAYDILHQAHLASMQFAMLAGHQMSSGVQLQMATQYQQSLVASSMYRPQNFLGIQQLPLVRIARTQMGPLNDFPVFPRPLKDPMADRLDILWCASVEGSEDVVSR